MHSFCRLFAFYLLYFCFIFFTLNSFAQSLCEQGFSAIESGEFIESIRAGESLVQNAEIKLEQDLKKIRNSPKELFLKAQGFKPSYYGGVDQAREFKRVQEYLEEIKADPEHTHIPYFADQVEKTISDFERGFREQHSADSIEQEIKRIQKKIDKKTLFLGIPLLRFSSVSHVLMRCMRHFLDVKEQLNLLEVLKESARKKIEDQQVTYNWWINFNLDIVLLAETLSAFKNTFSADKQRGRFTEIAAGFPQYIMFFSTDELGVMAFNRMGEKAYLIGVSGRDQTADGMDFLNPSSFFGHDVLHIRLPKETIKIFENLLISTDQEVVNRMNNISNKSDREKVELILFMSWHERRTSLLIKNQLSQEKEGLFDMFCRNLGGCRFKYGDILPENVLESLKLQDTAPLQEFVEEAMDVFIEHFSDLLRL